MMKVLTVLPIILQLVVGLIFSSAQSTSSALRRRSANFRSLQGDQVTMDYAGDFRLIEVNAPEPIPIPNGDGYGPFILHIKDVQVDSTMDQEYSVAIKIGNSMSCAMSARESDDKKKRKTRPDRIRVPYVVSTKMFVVDEDLRNLEMSVSLNLQNARRIDLDEDGVRLTISDDNNENRMVFEKVP